MGTLKRLGVFDSGLGGLTVLNEICKYNTGLDVVYFGDTARVPYGSRTVETITRYAEQDVRFLLSQGVQAILIACGTVSTNCLPALQERFSLPIVGVIDAGCRAALEASRTKRIGVIGTRATVNSHAYERRIRELCPEARTWGVECPLFVPLIENGFAPDDPITEMTVERYLSAFRGTGVDTVIMGCTHYPFLAGTLRRHMPEVALSTWAKPFPSASDSISICLKAAPPTGSPTSSATRTRAFWTSPAGIWTRYPPKTCRR